MNFGIEFSYSVLISLLTLLWLAIEYMSGVQDLYISWYPLVSLVSITIPAVCYQRAFSEKKKTVRGKLTFGQAIVSGLVLTFFCTLLTIPTQWFFLKYINPDFLSNMLDYSTSKTGYRPEAVAMYLNKSMWIIQSMLYTVVLGVMITLILSWPLRSGRE